MSHLVQHEVACRERKATMPSKGVDYYAYVSTSPFSVAFSKPTDWGESTTTISFSTISSMLSGNVQIDETDIGISEHTGRFQWTAYQNGGALANRYAKIAPLTGNLGDADMGSILQTPSLIGSNYALSYGFYDAGPGWGSLTNQDQSYIYLTDNYSTWMSDLASAEPALLNQPFSVFALPGAHDAGMFDTTYVSQLVGNSIFQAALAAVIGPIGLLASSAIMRAVINLAFTQKDTITTMLNLGVRYFDFRPGYYYGNISSGICHQHNFIPGYPYQSFLNDVLTWLQAHPREIIVVSANFQGFASDSMRPAADVLTSMVMAAQLKTGTQSLAIGGQSDLSTSIGALIDTNKRLIFLNQVGAPDDATKYDSYNGSYATTSVDNILAALNGMQASQQASYTYTVLQLQGTANSLDSGSFTSIATMSDASSPLMSTKANFDHSTYPWLSTNVPSKFSLNNLIVFLNDFVDNALVSYAIRITRQRAGL
jgi:hypothetical protein